MSNPNKYIVNTITFLLKTLAVWALPSNSSRRARIINSIHYGAIIVGTILSIIQVLIFVVTTHPGVETITVIFYSQLTYFPTIAKVTMYRIHSKKLRELVESLQDSLENGPDLLLEYLQPYIKIGTVIYGMYALILASIVAHYVLAPLFKFGFSLPFLMWYPFDYTSSTFLYAVAYCHQVVVIYLLVVGLGAEILFGVIVLHCCAKLKYLQSLLQTISTVNTRKDEGDNRINLSTRISNCVEYQIKIFKSINDINDSYKYIVLTLTFTAIVILCSLGFQMLNIHKKPTSSLMLFVFTAVFVCLQLLLYHWPSDIFIDEALSVATAAYNSNWDCLPLKHRKSILLILRRSMIAPTLRIGQISTLSLENYSKFLATAMSYLTSLRSIAGDS